MRLHIPAVGTAGLLAILAASAPASAADRTETFYLDTHGTAGTRYVTGPSTPSSLTAGRKYKVTVSGTISLWAPFQWTSTQWVVCGTPRTEPSFPSPGRVNGPAGIDAEGRFALVQNPGACPSLPVTGIGNFQLSVAPGTFYSPEPKSPRPPKGPDRAYTYDVEGTGAPLTARFFDPASADNYGRFKIVVKGKFD